MPLVLILWVVADLFLRLLPASVLGLDPWLLVSRFPDRFEPFIANQHFHTARFIGGNATMANLKPTEVNGSVDFSTNQLGFRLNPFLRQGESPELLFVKGDSFMYGAGLSDGQTLPSVMTSRYGIPSFNAARFHDEPDGFPELDWLLAKFPQKPKTVVWTYLEHHLVAAPDEEGGWRGPLMRRDPKLEGDIYYARTINDFFWQLAPTKVVSTRLFKQIADGGILPNAYKDAVKELRLPNGERMLFRDYEFGLPEYPRDNGTVARTGRYFEWVKKELDARHIRLVVLILPCRYTVYGPLLGKPPGGEWLTYLDRVEQDLRNRNITVVNTLRLFRERAPSEITTGNLSFYREDTHWNARGVENVAAYLAGKLPPRNPQLESKLSHAIQ